MAERYSAVRFDDPGPRARDRGRPAHEGATASRWLDRLIATNPDTTGALMCGADVSKLGERPRAVGLYKRALDLAPEDTTAMQSSRTSTA